MTNTKTLKGMCESCMMPFKNDPLGANREHEKHCSFCYRDGKLCYQGNDVRGFKKAMIADMVSRGEPKIKAWIFAWMAGFAPRWKKR